MTFVVLSPCVDVKDGACADMCPADCFYEGETMLYINPDECVSCGLCESVCPVDAIRSIEDVPEEEEKYIAINRDFFADGEPKTPFQNKR